MVANGLTPTSTRQRWEEFCEFKASPIYTDFQASKTLTLKKKVDHLIVLITAQTVIFEVPKVTNLVFCLNEAGTRKQAEDPSCVFTHSLAHSGVPGAEKSETLQAHKTEITEEDCNL